MKFKYYFIGVIFLANICVNGQTRTDSIHIAHYELNISIVDFLNHTIEGVANLQAVPLIDQLPHIELDLLALTVDSVFINNINSPFSHQNSSLKIPLTTAWNSGDTVAISIHYHGVPVRDSYWGGFYFSGQYAYNLGVAFQSIPHNFGRCWFPCIDMFTDKSTYRFNIRTENNKMAVCGGLLTDSLTLADNTRIWTWELSQPIPTYLASVAVGEYRVYRDTFLGISGILPVEIYAPPAYLNNIPGSFINLKSILRSFENKFGAYPFDRVGYVGVNFNNGAMEHAANIAYPQSAINGNTSSQSLYAHELSHSWFGNSITCHDAGEMWINEGFASYCEALVIEALTPEQYTGYMRTLHQSVLKNAHLDDEGYFALNNVPQNVTYGTTSYDKGALIVFTLRNYLGDSLFFTGIKSLLNQYAFKNITSEELCSYLTQVTGVNLQGFYEGWINQPGFLHFSVDSITCLDSQSSYYRIFLRQKLHQAQNFANQNKVDITFFSNNREHFTTHGIEFSGEYGIADVTIPFNPVFAIVDYNEKLADAIIDYNLEFYSTGSKSCSEAGVTVSINNLTDTAFVRVEHNLVAPDPLKISNPDIYRISENHYWRIEFASSGNLQGYLQFRYYAGLISQIDYHLVQGYGAGDLVLLYRRNAGEDWHIIPFTRTGSLYSGILKSDLLLPGEYTLGIGNALIAIGDININSNPVVLLPNPSSEKITLQIFSDIKPQKVVIFDSGGKFVKFVVIEDERTDFDISDLKPGIYYVSININKQSYCKKFIKE